MDLRWGYNNVQIKEGNEWKAAFVCFCGVFEPLVMYFRLCNSSTTFQAMMNEIFTDMDDVVVVYINDLMIFTKQITKLSMTKLSSRFYAAWKKMIYLSNQKNACSTPHVTAQYA